MEISEVHKVNRPDLIKGRDLHRVTTKAVIYTPDASHVLIMYMYKGTDREMYGMPGGHIDQNEAPDETIARELHEELGITVFELHHADFFIHENGKIVLAYTAQLPYNAVLRPSDPAKEFGVWFTKIEFEHIKIESNYRNLVLNNWPTTN